MVDTVKVDKALKNASGKRHWRDYWGGTGEAKRSIDPVTARSSRAVLVARILMVFVLTSILALLAWLAFKLLSDQEDQLAQTQFDSISERALIQAKEGVVSRRWAGITLAKAVGELYPDAEQWPYIEWQGFEQTVRSMLETSRSEDMGFVPFVDPANLTQFEDFAQGLYEKLDFPNTTAVKDWGFGVWARNKTVDPVQIYHDTTAFTPYGSPYSIIAPILRTDEGSHPVLLFNVHSQKFTGDAIDRIITCSERRKEKYAAEIEAEKSSLIDDEFPTMPPNQCGVITDVFFNVKLGGRFSVANFNPIYPKNDPLKVVGYIPAISVLDTLLENMFSKQITGIDAVFESDARTVTWTIVEGKPILVGEGNLYSTKYKKLQKSLQLADPELFFTDDGSNSTKKFILTLTPNDAFYETYQTNGPAIAAAVVVCSILLTILVFFLYDFYVRREFNAKRELLEARRQFMRFVSHEVRTPLNAVSMGLDLMQSEVAKALGYDSTTSMRASHEMVDDDAFETSETGSSQRYDLSSSQHFEIGSSQHYDIESPPESAKSADPPPVRSLPPREKNASNASLPSVDGLSIPGQMAKSWFQLSQEIQSNAQGAVDILNDLLNYDKIEQGTLQLSLGVLSMWDLIEKAILEFKVPASSKKVHLGIAFGEETRTTPRARDIPSGIRNLKVVGDPVRLSQVVRNLMSNALKFTPPEGSVRVQAVFVYERSAEEEEIDLQNGKSVAGIKRGHLRVRVIDTGAGMSPDQVSNLFQEGVQFNANELQAGGGSGLGLYIAKGIVMQHGGNLRATSEGIGFGTTFEMTLPLWDITSDGSDEVSSLPGGMNGVAADDTTKTGGMSTRSLIVPKAQLKVLVVDDVKSNRKLLIRLLENKGHTCDEAVDGQDCVDMVKKAADEEAPYDSILLDYEMPVMDGPTAAKEIRQKLMDETDIVGVTGNVLPEDVRFFEECGADDVLAKPVKIKALMESWQKRSILERTD